MCKTLKMEGPAFRNIGKNIYIFPTVKSALLLLVYAILNALYGRGSCVFPLPIVPRALSIFSIDHFRYIKIQLGSED